MIQWILVFAGGGLGSMFRFGISKLTSIYGQHCFPIATLISNFLATMILGIILFVIASKQELQPGAKSFLIIGFCGGFSTFSTFSYETFHLIRSGMTMWAIANVVISVFLGLTVLFAIAKIM